jgi:hypothetical protein
MNSAAVDANNAEVAHRAAYTLVIGEWHATCRICGFVVVNRDRRKAAAEFRHHIRAMYDEQRSAIEGVA